ncbi:hypothetical protein CBP52_02475 [Cellulomonas sp. PSBB021]|nr:hypothetical protein CBP52_02475 [Cellulomonas sp. PSBB021]
MASYPAPDAQDLKVLAVRHVRCCQVYRLGYDRGDASLRAVLVEARLNPGDGAIAAFRDAIAAVVAARDPLTGWWD